MAQESGRAKGGGSSVAGRWRRTDVQGGGELCVWHSLLPSLVVEVERPFELLAEVGQSALRRLQVVQRLSPPQWHGGLLTLRQRLHRDLYRLLHRWLGNWLCVSFRSGECAAANSADG